MNLLLANILRYGVNVFAPVTVLSPSENWTGTAGSGFTTVPSDSVRTTAKPSLRIITPPWQWFAPEEKIVVGFGSAANNLNSLYDNLGVDRVRIYYEGNTADILSPSLRSIVDVNGVSRLYWGWWIELENDGRFGATNLYAEAIPKDPSMQSRVIGPFLYRPNATKYTHQVEVAATPSEIVGVRYKTLANAVGYLRNLTGKINPLITITEAIPSGEWKGHNFGFNLTTLTDSFMHITATVPVTFTQTASSEVFEAVANGIHPFGSNITFDFKSMNEMNHSGGWPGHGNWMDGINIINSDGAFDLKQGATRNVVSQLFRGTSDPTRMWFTECVFDAVWNVATEAELVRGTVADDCWGDLYNGVRALVGTVTSNWGFKGYRDSNNAFTITYLGTEATASFEMSGNNGFNNRVVTARWGANSATFTILNTPAAFAANTNYTIANVVNWVNTTLAGLDAGWSATLLDNTRRAANIARSFTDPVNSYPLTNVKNSLLTVGCSYDIHGDWYQIQNTSGVAVENRYVADNFMYDSEGQIMLLGGDAVLRDITIINNAWHMKDNIHSPNQFSQFARGHNHVVIAHNTMVNQGVWLRVDNAGAGAAYNPDARSLFANNVVRSLEWIGTVTDADGVIANNHLEAGFTEPVHATGTTIGGTDLTLFADAATGDFTPAGDLLTNLKPPIVARDLEGAERLSPSPAGALT